MFPFDESGGVCAARACLAALLVSFRHFCLMWWLADWLWLWLGGSTVGFVMSLCNGIGSRIQSHKR